MIILSHMRIGRGVLRKRYSTYGKRNVGKAIIGAFFIAFFLKFFILDFMVAEGQSMAPAIRPGTVIFVCRVFYGIRLPLSGKYILQWRDVREGDVVVFYTPHGDIAVKRFVQVLPGGMFFALGDNAAQSYDSRNYGTVSQNNIIGRVLGIR